MDGWIDRYIYKKTAIAKGSFTHSRAISQCKTKNKDVLINEIVIERINELGSVARSRQPARPHTYTLEYWPYINIYISVYYHLHTNSQT